MNKKLPVITLVGAGSRVFGFNMATDICQTPVLKGSTIRLVDVDETRLAEMKRLFDLVSDLSGSELRISAYKDRRKALPGSDFVILSVARERIKRWEMDLKISRKYGITEVQGECGGPGGLSLTLRNIPLVLEIARDVERLAPKAMILNFTNPMTRVCLALTRYTKVKAVGLCHGLFFMQAMLSRLAKRSVEVKGCGINHFNWISSARWADSKKDALPQLMALLSKAKPSAIKELLYARDLAEIFGQVVSPDDIHITDFLHHWRGTKNGLNRAYQLPPKEMAHYRADGARWETRMKSYLKGEKNPLNEVKGLSGEGAIPIIASSLGLSRAYHEIAANIPNCGAIANLPDDAMVEVPARISTKGIAGEPMGDLPLGIRSLITRQLDIAQLAVEAAVEGNTGKALQALAIDPIITDLSIARGYLKDVLRAHKGMLPNFD